MYPNERMTVAVAILVPVGIVSAVAMGCRGVYLYYRKKRLRTTQTIFRGLSPYEYNPVSTVEEYT